MLHNVKMVPLIATAFLVLCLGMVPGEPHHEMKPKDVRKCFFTIICDQGKIDDIREKFFSHLPSECMETILHVYKESLQLDAASDTDDFWHSLPDKMCKKSDDWKKELFIRLADEVTAYYRKNCESTGDAKPDVCSQMHDGRVRVVAMYKDYFDKSICTKEEDATTA